MKICRPEMPALAHTRHVFGYSQEIMSKISSLHSRLIFRRRLIRVTVCVHRNFYQRLKKMNYYTRHSLKWKWTADGPGFDPRVRQHSFVATGHGINSTAIISLTLIQVGLLSITTAERMCSYYWLTLRKPAQEQCGYVNWPSRHDHNRWLGRKTKHQINIKSSPKGNDRSPESNVPMSNLI